ncbi:hypothetical protein UPYG_G00176240 [Umbra pygmaea]|uniref:RRM domain-containing protein n=1 Tax=Umbra pygmaea TaxID=75934 RepID=A0ABD0XEZ8_UMBPY
MAVVIRLQGLPIVAGTMDIRHFFSGLTIPDGGVHIVGGEHGEAFIVFATDEDARLGMMRTGGAIKGSKVSLLLSSKTEMQNMIELSRRRFETGNVEGAAGNGSRPGPPVSTGGMGSLPTTLQGFSNTTPTTVTTAVSAHETISNKNVSTFATTSMVNMPPSFSNNFSSPNLTMGSTMTTASLNSVPPPVPPLPTMPSLPPMPSIPPLPIPPPVSSMPPVPTVSPLTQGHPLLPMSHLSHMGSMPPFNPGVPPPGGLASGLPLGTPNHMFLGHMNPLLNLQAHMKAAIGSPDELYVHLQGMPFSATEMDVREFFRGLGVDSVRLVRDNMGRGSGRALAKFFSPQDTFEALKRSTGMLGQRYVDISLATERQWISINSGQAVVQLRAEEDALNAERLHRQKLNGRDAFVHLVTFEQMKEIERYPPPQVKRGQKLQGNSQGQGHGQAQNPPQSQAHPFAGMTGNGLAGPPLPPLAAGLGDVALSVPPPMVAGHLPGAGLEPPGFRPGTINGPPGFGPEGLRGMPPFDNGSRKSGGHSNNNNSNSNNRGGIQGRSGGGPPSTFGPGPGPEPLRGQSAGGPGNPHGPTVVKIQNMPFTVTVDEILDFFYGYQVLPGSVCLQFSEKGLPTGEAMVAFESHEEATSAVMDLNDRPIGARKVKITLG